MHRERHSLHEEVHHRHDGACLLSGSSDQMTLDIRARCGQSRILGRISGPTAVPTQGWQPSNHDYDLVHFSCTLALELCFAWSNWERSESCKRCSRGNHHRHGPSRWSTRACPLGPLRRPHRPSTFQAQACRDHKYRRSVSLSIRSRYTMLRRGSRECE